MFLVTNFGVAIVTNFDVTGISFSSTINVSLCAKCSLQYHRDSRDRIPKTRRSALFRRVGADSARGDFDFF